jgi:hypothetical protein
MLVLSTAKYEARSPQITLQNQVSVEGHHHPRCGCAVDGREVLNQPVVLQRADRQVVLRRQLDNMHTGVVERVPEEAVAVLRASEPPHQRHRTLAITFGFVEIPPRWLKAVAASMARVVVAVADEVIVCCMLKNK